jgi:hypothetical protein
MVGGSTRLPWLIGGALLIAVTTFGAIALHAWEDSIAGAATATCDLAHARAADEAQRLQAVALAKAQTDARTMINQLQAAHEQRVAAVIAAERSAAVAPAPAPACVISPATLDAARSIR